MLTADELGHSITSSRVLVVGDVILDKYVEGGVARVSPEAPVPVLKIEARKKVLGGAANVARNITALGGAASIIGAVGQDAEADEVRDELRRAGIDVDGLIPVSDRPTISKTRIVAQQQQIVRIDHEEMGDLPRNVEDALLEKIDSQLSDHSIMVLSDYGKGVISAYVAARSIKLAQQHGVKIVVDPKGINYSKYAGASVITPNLSEFSQANGKNFTGTCDLSSTALGMMKNLSLEAVVVTRGSHGMCIFCAHKQTDLPTIAREVFDVSGAGDTVVSVISMLLSGGLDVHQAALFANAAAGVVVGKRGTASLSFDELVAASGLADADPDPGADADFTQAVSVERAIEVVHARRGDGKRIGFTNGCFDLVHSGHVRVLSEARKACDFLVVGLNSNASVSRLKGAERPLVDEIERSIVLAAFASVDLVVVFEDDTPLDLIQRLEPDVLIKGGDYSVETIVGAEGVLARGGQVKVIDLVPGRSTTSLANKIKTSGTSAPSKGGVVAGSSQEAGGQPCH